MREILVPPLRVAAVGAFVAGLALMLLDPPSFANVPDLLLVVAGAGVFLFVMAWITVALMGDEMPEHGGKSPKSYGGTPVSFFVYGESVDAAWKRAVDAGAKIIQPLDDQFWGDRTGCLEDPFGHRWWLAQHIKDMTPDELAKAAESAFSQMQAS